MPRNSATYKFVYLNLPGEEGSLWYNPLNAHYEFNNGMWMRQLREDIDFEQMTVDEVLTLFTRFKEEMGGESFVRIETSVDYGEDVTVETYVFGKRVATEEEVAAIKDHIENAQKNEDLHRQREIEEFIRKYPELNVQPRENEDSNAKG